MLTITRHVGSCTLPVCVAGIVEVRVLDGRRGDRGVLGGTTGDATVQGFVQGVNSGIDIGSRSLQVVVHCHSGADVNTTCLSQFDEALQSGSGIIGCFCNQVVVPVSNGEELPVDAYAFSGGVEQVQGPVAIGAVPTQEEGGAVLLVADAIGVVTLVGKLPEAVITAVVVGPDVANAGVATKRATELAELGNPALQFVDIVTLGFSFAGLREVHHGSSILVCVAICRCPRTDAGTGVVVVAGQIALLGCDVIHHVSLIDG